MYSDSGRVTTASNAQKRPGEGADSLLVPTLRACMQDSESIGIEMNVGPLSGIESRIQTSLT